MSLHFSFICILSICYPFWFALASHFYLWVLHLVAYLSNWFLVIPSIATKSQYVNSPFFIFLHSLHVSGDTRISNTDNTSQKEETKTITGVEKTSTAYSSLID
jgi:hypothetical protein